MRKSNKPRAVRRTIIFLCILLCISVGIGMYLRTKPDADSGKNITQIAEQLSLDTEYVKIDCMDGIVKIDIVTPGLDTCTMRVAIYDLKTDKILSQTELKEGAWVTGLTHDGFYAAEHNKKILYIYNKSGKLKHAKNFSETEMWSPVCGLSEDEKYFIYTLSRTSEVYACNLQTDEVKKIGSNVALREQLGFYNGILYAAGMDNNIVAVDVLNFSVRTEVGDSRLNSFSPYYGIGTTEYNFIAADKSGIKYVPINSVDELVVGIGKDGFATSVSNQNGETLNIYNLDEKTLTHADINDTVESVCFTDDGRLLVLAGDAMEKKHKLYLCNPKKLNKDPLTVNSADIPERKEPQITVPKTDRAEQAKIIENVPVLSQFPEFPTGCESVSAVMVLKFLGEDISAAKFIDEYLPKNAEFYWKWTKRYGPSPYEFFIGNPGTSASYGCMAPVIEKALCDYFGGSDRVRNTTGTELSQLCKEYIDNNIPVIVWATINMLETVPKNSWYLSDGKRFTWPGNEHCMVLTGYDSESYYFNDPYAGKLVKYEKETVEQRYSELGKQSVAVLK